MARRTRGDGTVFYDTVNQRWTGRVTIDGKRRTVVAKTKTEAARRLREIRSLSDAGKPVADGNLTVAQLLEQWTDKGLPSRNVQPASRAVHAWAVKAITKDIGTKRIRALSPTDIETMLQERADNGLSKASLSKLRTTLRIALHWAERRDMIPRNVATVAELPADARTAAPRASMTHEQLGAFLAAADAYPYAVMWRTMVTLGLRPGEAAGLSWDDIDFDNNIIHIRRALKRDSNGALYLGDLKTVQSARSLDAPPTIIDALQRRRTEQETERTDAAAAWSNPDNLIWTNSVGSPTDPARIRHTFTQVANAADIGTGWSPNSLRHTAASLLSDAGIPLEDIADQLGHKDTRMASLHYRHRVRPTISTGLHMNTIIETT
jgi:integrase